MLVNRLDKINAPDWMTEKFERTSEGYLKGRAVITSTGIFEYRKADGAIAKELRLPEVVFDDKFLKSLHLKPVTLGHPAFAVTADNIKDLQIGALGTNPSKPTDGTSDNHYLAIDMVIYDKKAIEAIEDGTRALSVGYSCELEPAEPGARWCGQTYDFIQRNLVANHLSVVPAGRQGDQAMIRLDSSDAILNDAFEIEEDFMADKVDELNQKLDEVEKLNATLNKDNAELQAKLDALVSEKTALEAERDTLKDKVDGLETKVKEVEAKVLDAASIAEKVTAKVALIDQAKALEVEARADMSDLDIKKAVITKIFPKAVLEGKSDAYIDARYDSALEYKAESAEASVRELNQESHSDNKDVVAEAKAKYLAQLKKE